MDSSFPSLPFSFLFEEGGERDFGRLVRQYNAKPVFMAPAALVSERQSASKVLKAHDNDYLYIDIDRDRARARLIDARGHALLLFETPRALVTDARTDPAARVHRYTYGNEASTHILRVAHSVDAAGSFNFKLAVPAE